MFSWNQFLNLNMILKRLSLKCHDPSDEYENHPTDSLHDSLDAGQLRLSRHYADPFVNYVPYEARRVEFLNDRVTAWTTTR